MKLKRKVFKIITWFKWFFRNEYYRNARIALIEYKSQKLIHYSENEIEVKDPVLVLTNGEEKALNQ